MIHIFTGRFGIHKEPDPTRCVHAVHDVGDCRTVGFHQCPNSPKVFVQVNGKRRGFCRIHSPEAMAKRRADVNARHEKKMAAHNANWDRIDKTERANAAAKKALEKIAAGHNDPRTLAIDTLKKFPKGTE